MGDYITKPSKEPYVLIAKGDIHEDQQTHTNAIVKANLTGNINSSTYISEKLIIDNNSRLEINGCLKVGTELLLETKARLIVHGDLIVGTNLFLLDESNILIHGNIKTKVLVTNSICQIQTEECLEATDYVSIGTSNSLIIHGSLIISNYLFIGYGTNLCVSNNTYIGEINTSNNCNIRVGFLLSTGCNKSCLETNPLNVFNSMKIGDGTTISCNKLFIGKNILLGRHVTLDVNETLSLIGETTLSNNCVVTIGWNIESNGSLEIGESCLVKVKNSVTCNRLTTRVNSELHVNSYLYVTTEIHVNKPSNDTNTLESLVKSKEQDLDLDNTIVFAEKGITFTNTNACMVSNGKLITNGNLLLYEKVYKKILNQIRERKHLIINGQVFTKRKNTDYSPTGIN